MLSLEVGVLCVKCGFQNSGNSNCCGKCGARLPRMDGGEMSVDTADSKVSERLQVFENAVSKVKSGEWDGGQFGAFLKDMADILAEKERGIRTIPIPAEVADEFREELSIGFSGMELYNRGLERMYSYVGDPKPAYLDEGLALVRQGNEAINEAMRINRANRGKLEELVVEAHSVI